VSVSVETDEEEIEDTLNQSPLVCECCQEHICYTDEVFMLEVKSAKPIGEEMEPITEKGEYVFPPQVLHLECWESVKEDITDAIQDVPTTAYVCEDPVMMCNCCERLINREDPVTLATFGELHVSQRNPNSMGATTVFAPMNGPQIICMECMVHVINDQFVDWSGIIDAIGINLEMEMQDA
jgi:hypothetical protein